MNSRYIQFPSAVPVKRGFAKFVLMLGTAFLFLGSAFAEKAAFNGPVNVIFDTDIALDIDDAMALAMVHALHDRHEINLVAVTVCIDDKDCVPYVDALNTFYGHPDVPIGATRNGLTAKMAWKKIQKGAGWAPPEPKAGEKEPWDFMQAVLKRNNPDGTPVYPHRLTDRIQVPEAVFLLRKTLAEQPDNSVVMIQVGNSANFGALMDSQPDKISDLSGPDLVKKKVRFLSVMAGTFRDVNSVGGWGIPRGFGINIFEDVESAEKVFSKWPTPMVISGCDGGEAIRFPGSSILHDYSYAPSHPISESYRAAYSLSSTATSAPDHHTCDPSATLYAMRPDKNYYSLSKPGKVTVVSGGNMRFDENENGQHRYLIANEDQKGRTQEAMMLLVSQPPCGLKH